jgi:predicted enzyme related to lactoylglutathione lyase
MRATSVTIGVPVSDLATASAWYTSVLGRAPDLEPTSGIAEYDVGGIWVQLDEDGTPGGDWVLRIGVPDLDQQRARLARLGITAGDTRTVPGAVTFFEFRDPDGNRLSCYQLLA